MMAADEPDGRSGWVALVINLLMLLMLISALAAGYAGARTSTILREETQATADLQAAALTSELARFRSLPAVLSRDSEVVEVLTDPDPVLGRRLDQKFAAVARETQIDVAYLLDRRAVGIAASNAPRRFCRESRADERGRPVTCATRFYFTGAMERGAAEFFALGRADSRPGMYFSHAVDDGAHRLGVVVAKVEFNNLERNWAKAGLLAFVTDEHGVVLISGIPEWRFRTLQPLPKDLKARLRTSGQFGKHPLETLPIGSETDADGLVSASLPDRGGDRFTIASAPLAASGWSVHVLTPASHEVSIAKVSVALLIFLSGILVMTFAGVLLRRRIRRALEIARQMAARDELERRVEQRTAELSSANLRLKSEMDERRRIARNLNRLQDELVQANKLATLGQIAAGVAHEINQPLAAIRTYADSSLVLLERNEQARAEENLGYIGELTERISVITDELRSFSRRSTGAIAPTDLRAAVDGALLLASHRLTVSATEVVRGGDRPNLLVMAERMRLEQVLVNLFQNALDAMDGAEARRLSILVEEDADRAVVHVQDTGPGLTAAAMKTLFMPFVTTKPTGLGLGLVISHDIVAEFGGELTARNVGGGARFSFFLRKAP